MRVLNVNMTLDSETGGGTAERTFQMSRFLVKAGVECAVLTTDSGLTLERLKAMAGVRVIGLPYLSKRFHIPRWSDGVIEDIVAGVDVIHLMNHWTFINALTYLAAKRLNKPYVVCPAGALRIYGRSKNFKHLYNRAIGKRIIRDASGYIAVTAGEIGQFQAYGVKTDTITIIPNGIDPKNFQVTSTASFRRKYGLGTEPFIMFMGRLHPIKGPDLLLRAFCNTKEKLPDFRLVFVGPDGGMLSELKEIVVEHDVESRVHFLGYLEGKDKSEAYHAADLLVIPSRHEAMSIVALEAGVTGTPVLLTDQCGFDDVDTVEGGRVVPASVSSLEEGLRDLLKDPTLLKVKGENLQHYVREHFTWDSVIKKNLDLYYRILNTN